MNDGSEGARLRDEGIDRAIAHADRINPRWADNAYEALGIFLDGQTAGSTFTSDDVIAHAYDLGLPKPPDGRAWGAVIMRASRAGAIVRVGFVTSRNPKHHKDVSALWRRAA